MIAADALACPIKPKEYSIDGITDILKAIVGAQRRYYAPLRLVSILSNRFDPHSVRQQAALRELKASFRELVLPAKILTRSAIGEALAAGVPVGIWPGRPHRRDSLKAALRRRTPRTSSYPNLLVADRLLQPVSWVFILSAS